MLRQFICRCQASRACANDGNTSLLRSDRHEIILFCQGVSDIEFARSGRPTRKAALWPATTRTSSCRMVKPAQLFFLRTRDSKCAAAAWTKDSYSRVKALGLPAHTSNETPRGDVGCELGGKEHSEACR